MRTGHTETFSADYLVGADGPRSAVRELLGIVAPEGGVLVRPDGYVAARWPTTPSFQHSAVVDALAAILR